MQIHWRLAILSIFVLCGGWQMLASEPTAGPSPGQIDPPTSVAEARARAKILHETVHGMLQVMHRDFFDEENQHAIPSASMEDVFHELERGFDVQVKWLNVQTDVLNVDHSPDDEFEIAAAKIIAKGGDFYEHSSSDRYYYTGRIRLSSQCLKCHVKNRLTADDRSAGLSISMPLSNEVEGFHIE